MAEASKRGFFNGNPDWSNLGQGQPEVGDLDGAPPRLSQIEVAPQDLAYGPVNGVDALRQAVADHYNLTYRQGRTSKYAKENVSIAQGGRLMLSRILAVLGPVNVGYVVPDYTAYEDMLDYHRHRLTPVAIRTQAEDGFRLTAEMVAAAVESHGLGAVLFSNPNNPTGQLLAGDDLDRVVAMCRARGCLAVVDEFYSHYIFDEEGAGADGPVSASAFVDDVDADPVLLVDGVTKNLRYPGLRLAWAVGPRDIIETLGRAASAIDGGASVPVQQAVAGLLDPALMDQETTAVRAAFARKRRLMLDQLRALGIGFPAAQRGTFYLWGSVENLPAPLDDAMTFFTHALARRVMVVPGPYFDINPGRMRRGPSPLRQWVRFSFGPPEGNMLEGLDRLRTLIQDARRGAL
ncbi:pyridoxal phosphate-dependent aminotransferase [Phenylobacterium sp. LH3H17]|uniref:pyridoxal phosphate-dependent aminotransferase n=1 Tax=Phenylobacterium sp. LH3H17 TaxID=2903901 RepID=UPI0020C961F0|nr:pyridoxal phosphate-dependent aminotransferase [Phenylobacterium sp. LH3H17]UTP41613.1 pyridoxal phosphate-dependent aminotransferase [Phenylobacterium sp. LH3H17]